MKILTLTALLAVGALAGCSTTTSNNTNARGANTNTGYLTNSETNSKPAVTSNVTNVSPGNLTTGNGNSTGSGNSMGTNSGSMSNGNANANRRP
jgi:hypothetical protein